MGDSAERDSVPQMWEAFLASGTSAAEEAAAATATAVVAGASAPYSSWHFGEGGAMADELVELVLSGTKRATAGALWSYELEGEALPQVGDYSVVTDGSGVARCVIRTTAVEVVAFSAVDEEFARTEGEGDGSLAYWRDGHWHYFTRELEAWGREPSADMPVVCERFEVLYPCGVDAEGSSR